MAKNTYSFHACFLFSVTGWLFFGGVFFASRAVHLRVAAFAVVSATAPVGPLAHTCSPHMSRLNRLDCENCRPAILMVVDHNFHRGRRLIVDLCRPLALHFHGDFAREQGQKGPGSRVANGSAEFFQRFRRTISLCASALPPFRNHVSATTLLHSTVSRFSTRGASAPLSALQCFGLWGVTGYQAKRGLVCAP